MQENYSSIRGTQKGLMTKEIFQVMNVYMNEALSNIPKKENEQTYNLRDIVNNRRKRKGGMKDPHFYKCFKSYEIKGDRRVANVPIQQRHITLEEASFPIKSSFSLKLCKKIKCTPRPRSPFLRA